MREISVSHSAELDMPNHSYPFIDRDGQVDSEEVSEKLAGFRTNELDLIAKLRNGDEAAFAALLDRYHTSLMRLALAHVSDPSVAEEVVQETWLAVLEGIEQFEGRSSLKTWIYKILTNKAKTRGVRERRHLSVSPWDSHDENDEPAVESSQFRSTGHWADYWDASPQPWNEETPEKRLLTKECAAYLQQATSIGQQPKRLRYVRTGTDHRGHSFAQDPRGC